MRTLAFDFETYYDDEKSVRPLGARTYFDSLSLDEIYLVTVACDDGYRFAGHPKDLDWSILEGAIALNHNAGFDQEGVRRLRELGIKIPEPAELHDTADLAAYCGYPRALAGVSHVLLNKILNKNVRDKDMKGKQWRDMDPDLRKAVSDYAIEDAVVTLEVWQKLSPRWPAEERLISRLSREWAAEGIAVDLPLIESSIEKLKATIWEAERTIPWVVNDNLKPLSPKALALECRKVGIVPPTSLAMDSEECDAWLDEHGEKYPWVMSMRNWRRANAILKKLEAMKVRTTGGRMRYGIKYWGAGMTGRWSGDAGVNVQNLSGKELFFVNMREHLVAKPGHILIAADLAQIEPRWTCWFTGEAEALAQMAAGVSPYIVYARQAMGLGPDEVWPKSDARYKIAKVSVLGAGYCAGHHRFIDVMRAYEVEDLLDSGPENPDTPEAYLEYLEAVGKPDWLKIWREASELEKLRLMRSWEIIMTFRNGRPKLTALWKELGDLAKMSAARGEDLVLGLPSGRELVYKKCRSRREPRNPDEVDPTPKMSIVADIIRNGQPQTTRIHQGILIENLCISGGSEVLTPAGWVRLDTLGDEMVWDGCEWVSHGGLISRGEKSTIETAGVFSTEDHLFLTDRGWVEAKSIGQLQPCAVTIPQYDEAQLVRKTVRETHGAIAGAPEGREDAVVSGMRVREPSCSPGERSDSQAETTPVLPTVVSPIEGENIPATVLPPDVAAPGLRSVSEYDRPLPSAVPPSVEKLRRSGDNRVPGVGDFREILGGHGSDLPAGSGSGPDRQQPRLLQAELPVGFPGAELPEQARRVEEQAPGTSGGFRGAGAGCGHGAVHASIPTGPGRSARPSVREARLPEPVYDILNCGPRNRFVVRGGPSMPPLIAHNCQSAARDTFRDCLINVHEAGYKIIFHVHDELIVEVPKHKAEAAKEDIERIMGIPPKWAKTLPVAAEATIAERYSEAK